MNPIQENAIREANNYLKAAGLPLYFPAEEVSKTLRHAKRAIENWCDLFPDKKDALDTIAIEAIQDTLRSLELE